MIIEVETFHDRRADGAARDLDKARDRGMLPTQAILAAGSLSARWIEI